MQASSAEFALRLGHVSLIFSVREVVLRFLFFYLPLPYSPNGLHLDSSQCYLTRAQLQLVIMSSHWENMTAALSTLIHQHNRRLGSH